MYIGVKKSRNSYQIELSKNEFEKLTGRSIDLENGATILKVWLEKHLAKELRTESSGSLDKQYYELKEEVSNIKNILKEIVRSDRNDERDLAIFSMLRILVSSSVEGHFEQLYRIAIEKGVFEEMDSSTFKEKKRQHIDVVRKKVKQIFANYYGVPLGEKEPSGVFDTLFFSEEN